MVDAEEGDENSDVEPFFFFLKASLISFVLGPCDESS
jgi:hypothetical protein